MRAVLSIGSNMDDRYALLQGVIDEFRDNLVAVSSIYATPPWGGVEQDDFLNAVLVVDRDDRDRARVRHDLAHRVPAAGHGHGVPPQRDDAAVEERLAVQHPVGVRGGVGHQVPTCCASSRTTGSRVDSW